VDQNILFESSNCIILYKKKNTHFDEIKKNLTVVHRLDYQTTGCILFVKNKADFKKYNELFKLNKVQKTYLAASRINLDFFIYDKPRLVNGFIASRYKSSKKTKFVFESETNILKNFKSFTKISMEILMSKNPFFDFYYTKNKFYTYEINLITGARHQIRSYFHNNGATLINDNIYGNINEPNDRIGLHSYKLSFIDPKTNEAITATADPQP